VGKLYVRRALIFFFFFFDVSIQVGEEGFELMTSAS
jgi:hypothetical protein